MAPQSLKIYGNNRVFCKGKFISGPDARSSIASFLMILIPSCIWQGALGGFLSERYSAILPFIGAILQVLSLTLLAATALSDPGIVPRQKEYTDAFDTRTKSYRTKQPPRYYDLVLRGHPFKLKYCVTCNLYRPPRCTHCSVCENCIERFDHHCPWIGNCIGRRNYWLFFSFVTCTGTLNVLVLVTCILQIAVLTQQFMDDLDKGSGDALLETMREEPLTTALAIYNAGLVWFTVGLCLYHTYLICTNQTTYEQIKGVYSNGLNPFHRGPAGNCNDVLFSRVRPRYFQPFTGQQLWPREADKGARELKVSMRGNASDKGLVTLQGPRGSGQAASVVDDPFLTHTEPKMASKELGAAPGPVQPNQGLSPELL